MRTITIEQSFASHFLHYFFAYFVYFAVRQIFELKTQN